MCETNEKYRYGIDTGHLLFSQMANKNELKIW